jgi:hypothetical protein
MHRSCPGTLVTGRVGGIERIPAFVLTKGDRERSRSYLPSLWRDAGGSPWLPRAWARASAPSLGLLSIGAVTGSLGLGSRFPPATSSPNFTGGLEEAPFYAPDVARALLDGGVPPSMRFPYGCKTTQSVLELDAQAAPV